MTLKNSFLTDVLENIKRRNWVFWLSFLTFFCYYPGALVLGLNNMKASYEGVTDPVALMRMEERMKEWVEACFQVNGIMPVLIIGLAILIGMQGFVYLHNKRQVDFYHSQPVSRKRRFLILWFNGIIIFAVTYLINMVLGMIVAAAYGRMSGAILSGALQGFLLYLIFFLGIYHISIIAILLTGNTLVSLLAMIVLLGYELGIRAMKAVMASSFFLTYGNDEVEKMFDTFLSPIVTIYKYILTLNYNNQWRNNHNTYGYGKTFVGLLVLAVVFGILSYLLYGKRASESHGRSISFPRIKEYLRFALLLLIGTFGSYLIYYVAGENIVFAVIGAVFFTILGHAVIQLIYEVDFRAIRKKWITAAISLAAVILVFLGFKYDWTGYDYRIPKQSGVESVYLSLAADGFSDNVHVMLDGSEIYSHSYVKNNMKLTDLDTVYELLENRKRMKKSDYNYEDTSCHSMDITFHLKNGKTESRNIFIDYEENMGILDKIYHMEEYQKANNQVMEDNFVENYKVVSATYQNGIQEYEVPSGKVKELIEAYKKDVENSKYAEVYYNIPIGKINIKGIGLLDEEYRNSWDVMIYASYKNTIDILKNAGIQYKAVFDEAYVEDIIKITAEYVDMEKTGRGYSWEECYKTLVYKDKEVIAKILEKAIPSKNRWWGNNVITGGSDLYMYVFKPNMYDQYYTDEIYFQPGELPDFILEDLEKASFGEETVIE